MNTFTVSNAIAPYELLHLTALTGCEPSNPLSHGWKVCVMPTAKTLEKIAKATGSRLKISFEPDTADRIP